MHLSTGHLLDDILCCLFPPVCPLCRRRLLEARHGFCWECRESFQRIRPPVCDRCGSPLPGGASARQPGWCAECLVRRAPAPAAGVRVRSAAYHTGSLRRAILRWKYGGAVDYTASLSRIFRQSYGVFFLPREFDCIVPVPLHPRRLRRRGFNQCVLLASPLARSLRIPLLRDAALRLRDTPPQSSAGRDRRRTNLRGAFAVREPGRVAGRSVLIVDDVTTTGATVDALAGALLRSGAAHVSAFTLARTPPPRGAGTAS